MYNVHLNYTETRIFQACLVTQVRSRWLYDKRLSEKVEFHKSFKFLVEQRLFNYKNEN